MDNTQDLEDIVRGAVRQAYEQGFADGQLAERIRPVVKSMVETAAEQEAVGHEDVDDTTLAKRLEFVESSLEEFRHRAHKAESELLVLRGKGGE